MRTRIVEAVQSKDYPGNWGKFLLAEYDGEWAYPSQVDRGKGLLRSMGWGQRGLWVLDMQTGEGAYFQPAGSAHADLNRHRVWVCPLFEPFLEWLYERWRASEGKLDLGDLPLVAELPGAPFDLRGCRRPGPEGAVTEWGVRYTRPPALFPEDPPEVVTDRAADLKAARRMRTVPGYREIPGDAVLVSRQVTPWKEAPGAGTGPDGSGDSPVEDCPERGRR